VRKGKPMGKFAAVFGEQCNLADHFHIWFNLEIVLGLLSIGLSLAIFFKYWLLRKSDERNPWTLTWRTFFLDVVILIFVAVWLFEIAWFFVGITWSQRSPDECRSYFAAPMALAALLILLAFPAVAISLPVQSFHRAIFDRKKETCAPPAVEVETSKLIQPTGTFMFFNFVLPFLLCQRTMCKHPCDSGRRLV